MNRVRIKMCGMTRADDAAAAAALGVDAIGLIFAPQSPRRLLLQQARDISAAVPPMVARVALFMDQPADQVRAVVDALQPELLQFHGREADSWCRQFGRPWLKAIAMAGDKACGLADYPHAAGLLLDGHAPGEAGGSGRSFDWSRVPVAARQPLILAGGLHAGNVAEAIRLARPYAVDVSSGVESAPGIKDRARMVDFVRAVASATRES